MTKKNYSKYEAKEELVTLSFNHVLLHKKDTKIYQVIFLSLLNEQIIQQVWEKANVVKGYNPNVWRQDFAGAWILP